MAVIRSIPLFGIVWLIYNALMAAGVVPESLQETLFTVTLPSTAIWAITTSDLFIFAGAVALYIEIFKATGTSVGSVIDHTLSALVFVAFLVEFIIKADAGNSTFMILTLMAFLDVIAGFTVTIISARRDIGVAPSAHP